jgi:SAM-dependent methyltransferase
VLADGTLVCLCCTYPVVAGIPYVRDDLVAQDTLHLLEKGEREKALFTLLGLKKAPLREFKRLLKDEGALTLDNVLPILCREEGRSYYRFRYTDPAYLTSRAVLRAVSQDRRCFARRTLDLCGGPGHLTRTFCDLAGDRTIILADLSFWALWLAKNFLAPSCQPVCCDANKPLPFAREAFSLVFCSDALHYLWYKRLFANEAIRLVGPDGVILLAHLHNALCENESAGMPLPPLGYRNLFEGVEARLFKETAVVSALLKGQPVDFSLCYADEDFKEERALILLATNRTDLFRPFPCAPDGRTENALAINPLYKVKPRGQGAFLRLRFPSSSWKEHFGYYRFPLPEQVELTQGMLDNLRNGRLDGPLRELAQRYVLLDLPEVIRTAAQ